MKSGSFLTIPPSLSPVQPHDKSIPGLCVSPVSTLYSSYLYHLQHTVISSLFLISFPSMKASGRQNHVCPVDSLTPAHRRNRRYSADEWINKSIRERGLHVTSSVKKKSSIFNIVKMSIFPKIKL